MGHGAIVQPEAVAQVAVIGPRPKHAGEEPQPHLHLAVQTDTFTWNLCTIRIEIGAEPSYFSGTTQEPSPSLSLLIFNHNILKEIP